MINDTQTTHYFYDHKDAANRLIDALPHDIENDNWLIVAISLEGIYYACKIAKEFNKKVDILFTESIMAPNNKECIIGAVSETEEIVTIDPLIASFGISLNYVYGEASRVYDEKILSDIYTYRKGLPLSEFKGKNILLVDEGCATGLSAVVAVKTAITMGAKTIAYAVPVIPKSVAEDFMTLVDYIFSVREEKDFVSVDHYYENYKKMDEQVFKEILEECKDNIMKEKRADGK